MHKTQKVKKKSSAGKDETYKYPEIMKDLRIFICLIYFYFTSTLLSRIQSSEIKISGQNNKAIDS